MIRIANIIISVQWSETESPAEIWLYEDGGLAVYRSRKDDREEFTQWLDDNVAEIAKVVGMPFKRN